MIKVRLLVAMTSILVLCFFAGGAYAFQGSHKEILGKWEGTGKDGNSGDEQSVTVIFKQDGKKIIAEIYSQAGNWTTDNVAFADNKWTIQWTTPEGLSVKVVGSIKSGIMTGQWAMGDDTGTFELKKIVTTT
jgi:hypothetical protein